MFRKIWQKIKKWRASPEKEITEFIEFEEKRFARWGYSLIKKILSPIVRFVWVHEVEGMEHVPSEGPCLIVSNHESYFDFICFVASCPRKVHYLAAEKFFNSWFWRPLMKLTGQIRVDRTNPDKTYTHHMVFSALKQNRMIGIFPEGTRAPDEKMLKAYTGVAQYALRARVPVVPVGVIGTREIMSRFDKFPRLNRKAKIKIGPPMHFDEYYGKENDEKVLREITNKIMLKIAELAGKEYPHLGKKD
jgi:1-acyl-sn-glycerol-3-phosphate acyltransferase